MSATAQELREALAGALAARAGLPPRAVAERAAAARDDAQLAEAVAQALVGAGAWIVDDPGARRVRLEELDALPALQELEDALDRRRARPLTIEQRLRLGRLYALIQRDEKGAACYRELLGHGELPLPMAMEIAEAAGRSGAGALALAGIDRVAETILTRDPAGEGVTGADILREDPLGAGALLERARDIALTIGHAPRAVALARAATALYERLGRRQEARESLSGQARALRAAGRAKRARQVAERWRELAGEDCAEASEARALGWLATEADADGALRRAADLRAQAIELLTALGDPAGALEHVRRRADLLERAGDLPGARAALERALDLAVEVEAMKTTRVGGASAPTSAPASSARGGQAAAATGVGLALRLEAARLDLITGELARAQELAGAVRAAHVTRGEEGRAAAAAATLAQALVAAGDLEGARRALVEAAPGLAAHDDPAAHGRARRARAELDAIDGRLLEAGLLLHDAAAAFRRASDESGAAACLLRRAELLAAAGDLGGCRLELERVLELTGTLEPRLELRMELLRALLAAPEEAGLLLDEVAERAPAEGDPWLRAAVAAARVRRDPVTGRAGLEAAAAELTALRDALPEPLRAGFARSPSARAVLEAARAAGVAITL